MIQAAPHPQDSTIINLLIANFVTLAMGIAGMYFKHKMDMNRERLASEERQREADRKAGLLTARHEETKGLLEHNTQVTVDAKVEARQARVEAAQVKQIVASTLTPVADDTNKQAHAIRETVEEINENAKDPSDAPRR